MRRVGVRPLTSNFFSPLERGQGCVISQSFKLPNNNYSISMHIQHFIITFALIIKHTGYEHTLQQQSETSCIPIEK